MTFYNPAVQAPSGLPADLSVTLPTGEVVRHILLGRPGAIRQTIHLLHNRGYVETSQWSPLIEVPEGRLILTPDPGEVISLLAKRL
ncbi:MAG: hypothetical protein F6K65_41935 [Moorea sp. SIO3C2]|nr:hypothetical protein [Moorena sp. SIO3C2]